MKLSLMPSWVNEKMKKTIIYICCLLVGLLPLSLLATEALAIKEVAPGIFVHQGQHKDVDEGYQGDICNIGFIVGKTSVAVIDTGGSESIGDALLAEIHKKTDLPIRYVINTHVHLDHIYGNVAFIKEGADFIGHKNLPDAMRIRKEFYEKTNQKYLNIPQDKTIQVFPNILIEESKSIEIDLGARPIKITAYPLAHTNTDVTVEDLNTSTLWTGDLLFIERTPVIDGDIHGFIKVLNSLMDMKFNLLIPGHGTPTQETKLAWEKIRHYLIVLRDGIRTSIDQGQDLQTAINVVARMEYSKWLLFDIQNARNINMIYPKMEWE
ncbi:MAG: quinoprotein relay system zinc metallohydrolase 2 [Proteobacteria bacterium]|mgnify:FL=1|nr:quinoprotein relay system zinc metallohydrolase 2 [Pseudomonadota bacterium]